MAVLVRYHTTNVYRAVVAWYYVAPGVTALLASLDAGEHTRMVLARRCRQ